jgi:hypothetical protein
MSECTRRDFLRRSAIGMSAASVLHPQLLRGAERFDEAELPPVRKITHGPRFHWFGYYDKLQFSPDNRFVLCNEVDFEGRSPTPDDVIRVGMVDTHQDDEWIEFGESRAWCWQQGCMLQWLPGSTNEVIWNDREGDRFVSHIHNVDTGDRRTVPHPVYNVSPDGRTAIAPDFARLNDCRPGYGYAGLPDANRDVGAPEDAGLWSIDLGSGQQELLVSLKQAADIPYEGEAPWNIGPNTKHWFNHLLFNTDGARMWYLHRWTNGRGWATRAFTANRDGSDPYLLDPYGQTSHFIWRDPQHVMAWAWHPSHKSAFYLYEDKTDIVEPVGLGVMNQNGHNTYLSHHDGQWVLNDTYPDKDRLQHPYLYHIPSNRRMWLGHFRSPETYRGEWRCDTHPRSNRDGTAVCIDSPHDGGRQLYLIDVRGIVT